MWLSEYKISKDRPILAKDLDFKTLIINSCENGNLNLVIPFVSCVFKYASFSKVFKSTNPWVCSILNLMAELNSNPILEQSVKTEIKNLFKNLKADINTWPKTNELEKCNIKVNSPYYGHEVDKEFINKRIKDPALADYINNLLGIFNSDPNINNQRFSQRKNNANNNNINPNNEGNYFYNTDNISNLLKEVMINSIQEIIPEIIDKNVKSSIMTSIFLVNKDFMFEKDENKYISSLENTMNVLAMSLSTMNSKELMKQYINMEFDKILVNKNLTKKTIEKIKQQPKSEFLSIGLDYIRNFINKEAPKILRENSLVKEVLEKRRQNNMNNNSGNNVFIDNKHYKDYIKVMKILPDKLHPNETCITDEEFKIYENFGKLFESMNKSIKEENGRNSFMNTIYRILKEVLDNTATNKARIVDYDYDFFMKNIQNVSHNNDFNNDENDLICLEKIVSECKITDKDLEIELAKKTLDYAVKNIKSGNILWLNVYSHILKGWVTLNPEISEEIIKYLLGLEDIFLRYKFDIYHNFLKKKVIDYEKLEKYLIEILNNNSSDLLARDLFEKLFQKTKTPHSYYFDHNSKYYYALFSNKSQICSKILDKINNPILNLKHSEQNNLGKFATFVLDHLTKYYLKNEDNKDVLNILKNEMNEMKNDTIKSESKNKAKIDMMAESNLYKIILIICEMCIKGPLENQKGSLYSCYPENLAISIYIIVYMQEKTDKLKLFTKIINYIMNFFERDYIRDVKDNFINQRGYFRFFYNLIYLLNMNQSDELFFDSEHKRVNYLYQISDFLKKNSPVYFTGFAMGWLELISCNIFISNFLEKNTNPQHQKKKEKNDKYEKYLSLLIELLNYLDSLNQKVISDYNYIIFLEQVHKFFFLLVNSYPEFISKYYYQLITCLSGDSSTFIQLKNILLSANPDNMPENDNDNINITLTNEEEAKNDENENENNLSNIKKTATILFDSGNALEENRFKNYIDKYINEQNENYLSILVKNLEKISDEKESNKICNMIIIYWSQSKYKYNLNEKSIRSKEIIYRFYEYLLLNLSKVQRDMLINAILNSLRFPCVQTFAYSILFQTLFFEIKNEEVIEHMLNNILIRLIYKPLPWGLKFTFINLNKTEGFQKLIKPYLDKYNLWEAFCNILNGMKKNDLMNVIDLE